MTELILPHDAPRLVCLAAQGLLRKPQRPAQKSDVLTAIRTLSALQIDTINIVARSPYLALFSRLGPYKNAWLDELLTEGQIFEFWAHAACFLPAEDFPYHRRVMLEGGATWFSEEWRQANAAAVEHVLAHIRANGPARSADFERTDGKKGSWWDWKVEKKALEYWFGKGELMVKKRQNFQRVYDLRERVRPDWDDRDAPALEESERQFVLRSVRALGLAKAAWVGDYFRLARKSSQRQVQDLAEEGRLLRVQVEGWDEPGYAHPDQLPFLEQAAAGELRPDHTTLLSPFDSLIWHRVRMRELFNFDFTIECYLPAPKRKYGYFLLPILHQGQLIGRLDAKAHRKEGIFEVITLYLEEGVRADGALAASLSQALRECAAWHATPQVIVRRTDPPGLLPLLGVGE